MIHGAYNVKYRPMLIQHITIIKKIPFLSDHMDKLMNL
jgi:hypothetical protein